MTAVIVLVPSSGELVTLLGPAVDLWDTVDAVVSVGAAVEALAVAQSVPVVECGEATSSLVDDLVRRGVLTMIEW